MSSPIDGQIPIDDTAEYENEPADPYVVAMAHELSKSGWSVVVATEDVVDRLPLKIALSSACATLGITTWDTASFVALVMQEGEGAPGQ